jgi:preprotein translocase subunit SecB
MQIDNSEIKSVLRFIDYNVEKIHFESNDKFEEGPVKIQFSVDADFEYIDDEDNTTLVALNVTIFDDPVANNYPFSMFVRIVGFFEIDVDENELKKTLAEKNAVSILFPYLRSIITTYTSLANVQPLILPPINVIKLIEANKKN